MDNYKNIFKNYEFDNGLIVLNDEKSKNKKRHHYDVLIGGDNETRTHDPLRARQVLSQLSYTPKWWTFRDSNPGPTGYEPVALTN